MINLTDEQVAAILKHLPRNSETKKLLARLNAYLNGHEYDVHAVFDGIRVLAVYRRGVVVATREMNVDVESVRDVLARMGYPRARRRHDPR